MNKTAETVIVTLLWAFVLVSLWLSGVYLARYIRERKARMGTGRWAWDADGAPVEGET